MSALINFAVHVAAMAIGIPLGLWVTFTFFL